MPVIRAEKVTDYTVVSNYPLRDKGLSSNAIGLLVLIKSLPYSWRFSVEGLMAMCTNGIGSITTALKELERAGYLRRERIRENGKFKGASYVLSKESSDISDGFTVISNYSIHDKNLSLGASGLLAVMLSLPDDWNYSVKGLSKIRKEGTFAIRGLLSELEQYGYVYIEQSRCGGRFAQANYVIRELPIENTKGSITPSSVNDSNGEEIDGCNKFSETTPSELGESTYDANTYER